MRWKDENLVGSISFLEDALEIQETVLGREHPERLSNLFYLAYLLLSDRELQGARERFTEARTIIKKYTETELGGYAVTEAVILVGLASTHSMEGQTSEAESLLRQSLAILEENPPAPTGAIALIKARLFALSEDVDGTLGHLVVAVHELEVGAIESVDLTYLYLDPDFEFLHGDPDFETIVADIKKRIGEE
jgi:tetratricopeptide (TPR) repeat protein